MIGGALLPAASEGLSLVCRIARSDVDLVPVMINFRPTEDLTMIAFERYLGNRKTIRLGAAAEGEGDCIANCNAVRQTDVMVGAEGAGHTSQSIRFVNTP